MTLWNNHITYSYNSTFGGIPTKWYGVEFNLVYK